MTAAGVMVLELAGMADRSAITGAGFCFWLSGLQVFYVRYLPPPMYQCKGRRERKEETATITAQRAKAKSQSQQTAIAYFVATPL